MADHVAQPPTAHSAPPKAVRILFTGRVQGVGFRYTAEMLAREHPIGGWVRNLPDGRVELFAEGPGTEVDEFLESLRCRWRGNIRNEQIETASYSGRYARFDITR